jgi:hypothetical protein
VAVSIVALPAAVRAARGEGTEGLFSATRRDCSARGGCAYYGTWTANRPGTAVVRDVLMDEWPPDLPLGSVMPALYFGETDPPVVYPADGSTEWMLILLAAPGGLVIAAIVLRSVVLEQHAARRSANYRPRRALQPESRTPDRGSSHVPIRHLTRSSQADPPADVPSAPRAIGPHEPTRPSRRYEAVRTHRSQG